MQFEEYECMCIKIANQICWSQWNVPRFLALLQWYCRYCGTWRDFGSHLVGCFFFYYYMDASKVLEIQFQHSNWSHHSWKYFKIGIELGDSGNSKNHLKFEWRSFGAMTRFELVFSHTLVAPATTSNCLWPQKGSRPDFRGFSVWRSTLRTICYLYLQTVDR